MALPMRFGINSNDSRRDGGRYDPGPMEVRRGAGCSSQLIHRGPAEPARAFLVWEAAFSVGVWEIDRQHRSLIGLINQLYESVSRGESDTKLQAMFSATVGCVRNHFAFEESYLERLGYEGLAVHKESHKELLDWLDHMRHVFDAGFATMSPELLKFLKKWVTAHILQYDRRYAALAGRKIERLMAIGSVDVM
jgi:hemerythrin